MLVEFRCKNFKNFKEELVFDLKAGKYDFSNSAVKEVSENNKVVKTALVYGKNGSGKTNLSLAIMDISTLLTDNEKLGQYFGSPLANLDHDAKSFSQQQVEFKYTFLFEHDEVRYEYVKRLDHTILNENLFINNEKVLTFDHICEEGDFSFDIPGDFSSAPRKMVGMPFVRYVKNNVLLNESKEASLFYTFYRYVETMLWFCSLGQHNYEGFKFGGETIDEGILRKGKLKEFQTLLSKIDIHYNLIKKTRNGQDLIYIKHAGGNEIHFFEIASKGTVSFALFYYWYLHIKDVSLLIIDEFDAFYHSKLAEVIVELLRESETQCLLTTHNTSIMSNELLRPDCYYNIKNGNIKSFSKIADSELRKIHNLAKMFKSGLFENV